MRFRASGGGFGVLGVELRRVPFEDHWFGGSGRAGVGAANLVGRRWDAHVLSASRDTIWT